MHAHGTLFQVELPIIRPINHILKEVGGKREFPEEGKGRFGDRKLNRKLMFTSEWGEKFMIFSKTIA